MGGANDSNNNNQNNQLSEVNNNDNQIELKQLNYIIIYKPIICND